MITHIKSFFVKFVGFVIHIPSYLVKAPLLMKQLYLFFAFFVLLLFFLFGKFFTVVTKLPVIGIFFQLLKHQVEKIFSSLYRHIINIIESSRPTEVKRSYLIRMAYRNLMVKKARSFITIFGMSVGVGIIVLLLSLGYGIEKLIINQVATLNELKILDVTTGENTALKLNKEAYDKIKVIDQVKVTIPLISVVGRVSYNKATTDVLVYSTSQEYLDISQIKLLKGKEFARNSLLDRPLGQVAGTQDTVHTASYGARIDQSSLFFNFKPGEVVPVYASCSLDATIEGNTGRLEGSLAGSMYWGSEYASIFDEGRAAYDLKRKEYLGKWLQAEVPLFELGPEDRLQPALNTSGQQKRVTGCIPIKYIQIIEQYSFGSVLGEATSASESATTTGDEGETTSDTVASDSAVLEVISLESTASAQTKLKTTTLEFKSEPSKQAIVSKAMVELLDIPLDKAINTTFNVSFIMVKSLIPDLEGKAFTQEVPYTIVGVIDDESTPYFYIPFHDTQILGVTNFTQIKTVVSDKEHVPTVRKQIETLGYRTTSALDTVEQIESLFGNLRIVLGLLGMVALAVASLGMFNTLTVSLLERTREIGGMKTMGVISSEVQDLFLAEAMIMGLSGGFGGVAIGYVVGKIISLIVSLLAFTKGQGYLELTYIPPFLIIFIVVSSFVVGVITGIYPAQRAKKISALNALRYE